MVIVQQKRKVIDIMKKLLNLFVSMIVLIVGMLFISGAYAQTSKVNKSEVSIQTEYSQTFQGVIMYSNSTYYFKHVYGKSFKLHVSPNVNLKYYVNKKVTVVGQLLGDVLYVDTIFLFSKPNTR